MCEDVNRRIYSDVKNIQYLHNNHLKLKNDWCEVENRLLKTYTENFNGFKTVRR